MVVLSIYIYIIFPMRSIVIHCRYLANYFMFRLILDKFILDTRSGQRQSLTMFFRCFPRAL
jgi:hypothetical protein